MSQTQKLENSRDYLIREYGNGKSTCELGREFDCSNALVYLFLRDTCGVKMRKKPQMKEFEGEIFRLFDEGNSIGEIGRIIGIPLTTINRWCKNLGLDVSRFTTHRNEPLRNHTEEILKKYLNGMGCYLLAEEYNCAESNILKILHENNINIRGPRQFYFNERFFQKIDNEEKAYFLGMMYGDGNNSNTCARLALTDKDVVEKLRLAVESESPIAERIGRKEHHKTQYVLTLSSVQLCNDLTNVGCPPKKTHIVDFPSKDIVPRSLLFHFLRGLMDADGTIYSRNGKNYIGYIGNDRLMLGIRDFIYETLNFKMKVYNHPQAKDNIIIVRIATRDEMYKLALSLYRGAVTYMDRKHENYLKFKTLYESKYPEKSKKIKEELGIID